MAKNIILFGAGASVPCGAPVMSNFLDEAQSLYAAGVFGDTPLGKSFANVFGAISALQGVHSKSEFDLVNIESIFTAFELAKTLQKFPRRVGKDIDQLIEDLKKLIINTLENRILIPFGDHEYRPLATYTQFVKRMIQGPTAESVAFLTFNYDLILDLVFHYVGAGVDYAIAKEPNKNRHIPLLKLHGSLNWGSEVGNEQTITPWFLSDYFSMYQRELVMLDNGSHPLRVGGRINQLQSRTESRKQISEVPVIIPPSWNKADSHRSISAVWARAAKELEEADSIFVIGYSLPQTDSFFKQLYALGTADGPPLKRFWVFNPDPSREEVFRQMLGPGARGRFRFEKKGVEEAFSIIATELRGQARRQ